METANARGTVGTVFLGRFLHKIQYLCFNFLFFLPSTTNVLFIYSRYIVVADVTLSVQLLYIIHTSTGTPWPVNTARCQPMRSMDYPHFLQSADVNRIHAWEISGNDG